MREGSLIIMIMPLSEEAIKILQEHGFKKWPVPDPDIIHMVTAMGDVSKADMSKADGIFTIGIQIDTFPEIANAGFWFNPILFREIEPPLVNSEKLFAEERSLNRIEELV